MTGEPNRHGNATKVAIIPAANPYNEFVPLFADAVRSTGREVIDASWKFKEIVRANEVIIHWPDFFFIVGQERRAARNLLKIIIARRLFKTKFIWVVHNLNPHGTGKASRFANLFFSQLDGILHLSNKGHELLNASYDIPLRVKQGVTVHGRYPTISAPSGAKDLSVDSSVNLINFGQIRPYKNVEAVLSSHAELDDSKVNVQVVGLSVDDVYVARLKKLNDKDNVTIDARKCIVETSELETLVDSADMVVLPYSRILNSGAAFFALSRNRPIVAPFAGALPELREIVGHEWVYLYSGELNAKILLEAVEWRRSLNCPSAPNLEPYAWDRVSRDIDSFLSEIEGRSS